MHALRSFLPVPQRASGASLGYTGPLGRSQEMKWEICIKHFRCVFHHHGYLKWKATVPLFEQGPEPTAFFREDSFCLKEQLATRVIHTWLLGSKFLKMNQLSLSHQGKATDNICFFDATYSGAQSCPTLCDPVDCSPPASSARELSQHGSWSGVPFLPPGDLPDPGLKLESLASPALAGRFFTIWATGEAPCFFELSSKH